jgi:hypothetical protein
MNRANVCFSVFNQHADELGHRSCTDTPFAVHEPILSEGEISVAMVTSGPRNIEVCSVYDVGEGHQEEVESSV